jgi:CHASE2 domain-containing sensor protein/predicted Ser/Thr protein kinase
VKRGLWSSDWFVGLVFAVSFLLVARTIAPDPFQRLETAAYDWGVRATAAVPDDRIAIIDIDDASLEAMQERWPWPRNIHAALIERLHSAGAKVIAPAVFLSEAQEDAGTAYLRELVELYDGSSLGAVAPLPAPVAAPVADVGGGEPAGPAGAAVVLPQVPDVVRTDLIGLRTRLAEATEQTDMDGQLAARIRAAGNVVLPMFMQTGVVLGRVDSELPDHVLANAIDRVAGDPELGDAFDTTHLTPPIAVLGEAAAGLGHLVIKPDVDGAVRFETLVLKHGDLYYPSYALAVAAKALNLEIAADASIELGTGLHLGNLFIGTTPDLEMYNFFYGDDGDQRAFRRISFIDVFNGSYAAGNFKDKVVLIGASAVGIGDTFATPVSAATPPVVTLAHTVSSILQEDFFTRLPWAWALELALFILIATYLCTVLPRLGPTTAALITAGLAITLVVTELSLMSGSRLWFQFMVPVAFLVSGHLLLTIKRLNLTEALKTKHETEGAESNRMLGLSLQGQGQLDMAFEKFRKLPKEPATLDLLYHLALDFERKRQHNKAHAVYQEIAAADPKFKDVAMRVKRSKQLEETVILGGGGGAGTAGTLILDSGDLQKPMLGRYEVEKELGKGAMGVVYLGKDPKINRTVAIKTMALGQEFEADELADAKERFFREAETAGRLNHPNIVTIFDAGEEHDLCYIAMEFLKGKDLTRFTKSNGLLSADKVFKIIADSAEALDYAHQHGVVHRDIKPANLMYEDEANAVKITDFGIARITDSSKTKTGLVLGTPSYMSPEQLSGQKVDGRSDLFSLGVTFYQMLSGQLPFQADSMATLMYKIANDRHAPLGVLRPDLPPCIEPILDKVLAKDAEQRYQRGADLARDIRHCAANLPQA